MSKKKPCKCFDLAQVEMEKIGIEYETALQINFSTGKGSMAGPFLSIRWKDKPPRGKRLPLMVCAYCPFCGKKVV